MPWGFGTFASSATYFFGFIGVLIAFIQFLWGMIRRSGIAVGTCLLVFIVGLLLTYGDYDYLTNMAKHSGLSDQWSGLSFVPDSAIEVNGYGKQLKIPPSQLGGYYFPNVTKINALVRDFWIRVTLLALSSVGAGFIALRRSRADEGSGFIALLRGWPSALLGSAGFGSFIIWFIP